jgi:hypothetical protein
MRDVARSSPGGFPPWTPEGRSMQQTALIKFRVTPGEKQSFVDAARVAEMSVSSLLRRAGRAVISGRVASRSILVDLVAVRAAANALAVVATDPAADRAHVANTAKNIADVLREIAARHLVHVR